MSSKIDKVIVTNFAVLKKKYGNADANQIVKALELLIAADQTRGLNTCWIPLDDVAQMANLSAIPVVDPLDCQQNKTAVDGIFKALKPDYLMLLGSIDVIPHQDLVNPVYAPSPSGDPDQFAFGDLPYACDAPYSQQPQDFYGPTRVVGGLSR